MYVCVRLSPRTGRVPIHTVAERQPARGGNGCTWARANIRGVGTYTSQDERLVFHRIVRTVIMLATALGKFCLHRSGTFARTSLLQYK